MYHTRTHTHTHTQLLEGLAKADQDSTAAKLYKWGQDYGWHSLQRRLFERGRDADQVCLYVWMSVCVCVCLFETFTRARPFSVCLPVFLSFPLSLFLSLPYPCRFLSNTHAQTQTYKRADPHACAHTQTHRHTDTQTHRHSDTYIHTLSLTHTHTHTRTHTNAHTHTHYAHTHTYTDAHIHTKHHTHTSDIWMMQPEWCLL